MTVSRSVSPALTSAGRLAPQRHAGEDEHAERALAARRDARHDARAPAAGRAPASRRAAGRHRRRSGPRPTVWRSSPQGRASPADHPTEWTVVSTSPPRACSPSRSARTRSPTTWRTPRRPATRPTAPHSEPSATCCWPTRRPARQVGTSGHRRPGRHDRDRLHSQARARHRRAAGLRHRRRGLLRRPDGPGHALHAQRPVRRQRRRASSSTASGRPGARPRRPARAGRRRRPRRPARARTSSNLTNPRKQGDNLVTGTPGGQRHRARSAPARSRARAPTRALDGRHDRVAARLRGRPEGHPDDRRDARQGGDTGRHDRYG